MVNSQAEGAGCRTRSIERFLDSAAEMFRETGVAMEKEQGVTARYGCPHILLGSPAGWRGNELDRVPFNHLPGLVRAAAIDQKVLNSMHLRQLLEETSNLLLFVKNRCDDGDFQGLPGDRCR